MSHYTEFLGIASTPRLLVSDSQKGRGIALGYEKETLYLGVDPPQKPKRVSGEINSAASCTAYTGGGCADMGRSLSGRRVLEPLSSLAVVKRPKQS